CWRASISASRSLRLVTRRSSSCMGAFYGSRQRRFNPPPDTSRVRRVLQIVNIRVIRSLCPVDTFSSYQLSSIERAGGGCLPGSFPFGRGRPLPGLAEEPLELVEVRFERRIVETDRDRQVGTDRQGGVDLNGLADRRLHGQVDR